MGFALVIVGEWGLTTGWVAIGLVGFGASLAISTIATRLDTRQSLLAARAELAILAVVILDMAIKPRL
jgi:hypothetical protein